MAYTIPLPYAHDGRPVLDALLCLKLSAWASEVAKVRDEDVAGADTDAKARTRENMESIAHQLDAADLLARMSHRMEAALRRLRADLLAVTSTSMVTLVFANALATIDDALDGRAPVPVDGGQPGSGQTGPRATQQGAATPGKEATAQGAVPAAGNVAEPQLDPTGRRVEHPSSAGSFAALWSSPAFERLVRVKLIADAARTEAGIRWLVGDREYEEMRQRLAVNDHKSALRRKAELDAQIPGRPAVLDALRSPATVVQPRPVPNDGAAIVDLVIADLRARAEVGARKYGMPLQANNGRVPIVDSYQEVLDLAKYIRQEIEERRQRLEGTAP